MSFELVVLQNEALFSLFLGDATSLTRALSDLKGKNKSEAEKCCSLLLRTACKLPVSLEAGIIDALINELYGLSSYKRKELSKCLFDAFYKCGVRLAVGILANPKVPEIMCPVHILANNIATESKKQAAAYHLQIKKQYELYTWGAAMDYQLGYPCFSDYVDQPRRVYFQEENKYADTTSIKDVAISKMKTVTVTDTGEVYTWGIDYGGKTFMVLPQKVQIDFAKDISTNEIVLSQAELVMLEKMAKNAAQYYAKTKEDFEVPHWLGKGHKKSGNMFEVNPEYCLTKLSVHKVACSNKHGLLCVNSGHVYSWGYNDFYQLGYELPQVPVPVLYQSSPHIVNSLKKRNFFVVDVACGDNHSVIMTLDGGAYGWGSNIEGQLGTREDLLAKPIELSYPEVYTTGKADGIAKVKACGNYTAVRSKSKKVLITDKKTKSLVQILTRESKIFEEIYVSPSYILFMDNEGSLFQYGVEWTPVNDVLDEMHTKTIEEGRN